ncbi:sigma-70 family RNA polymerase sigma factor [Streptomyces sp. NPDC087859]|uniref:sigma-70 family RNA polymerase sigma factor n=1 Tax=Streptomyces sp. NPDC087859 TaxID=3365812 RepID=UPI0037F8D330
MSDNEQTVDLEAVFACYYGEMVGYARKWLRAAGVADWHEEAEDIVQHAFAKACRDPGRISQPRAYLYKVIKNQLKEYEARAQRAERTALLEAPAAVVGVEEMVVEICDVQRALAKLPPQQRMAVYAAKALAFTQAEVAEAMGKRPGTVAVHIARAVQILRATLVTTAAVAGVLMCLGATAGLRFISAASRDWRRLPDQGGLLHWGGLVPWLAVAGAASTMALGFSLYRIRPEPTGRHRPDFTTMGLLLVRVPNLLCSFFVVVLLASLLGRFSVVAVVAWLASGVLMFHRATEDLIARYVLRMRHPTPLERARLEPVWREVAARAGLKERTYTLWMEDSNGLTAVSAGGHILGVTRAALHQLNDAELAAILAHELGHQVGGSAWSSLLAYWYALPGRMVWFILRTLATALFAVARVFGLVGITAVVLLFASLAWCALLVLYGLPVLMLAMPYFLAAVGRRAELNADQFAASLGFGPVLSDVIQRLQHQERPDQGAAGGRTTPHRFAKVLAPHPDCETRLELLKPYGDTSSRR